MRVTLSAASATASPPAKAKASQATAVLPRDLALDAAQAEHAPDRLRAEARVLHQLPDLRAVPSCARARGAHATTRKRPLTALCCAPCCSVVLAACYLPRTADRVRLAVDY